MIDIREHGGNLGASKYRKNYMFRPDELGLRMVPTETLVTQTYDSRIDGLFEEPDGTIWTCGYSTSYGTRYAYKNIWNPGLGSYQTSLVISNLSERYQPNGILVAPGQPYVYLNDIYFKRYDKNTGTMINSFSLPLYPVRLSEDGKYIYGFHSSSRMLYKLNLDLSIVAQINTATPFGDSYGFVDGRYFVMQHYGNMNGALSSNSYKFILYDMGTLRQIYHPTQNQNGGMSNAVSNTVTVVTDGTHIINTYGQHAYKYRMSDMYLVGSYQVAFGTSDQGNSEVVYGIYDYDDEYYGILINKNSVPYRMRKLKKLDMTVSDVSYVLKVPSSTNLLYYNKEERSFLYCSSANGAWFVAKIRDGFKIK